MAKQKPTVSKHCKMCGYIKTYSNQQRCPNHPKEEYYKLITAKRESIFNRDVMSELFLDAPQGKTSLVVSQNKKYPGTKLVESQWRPDFNEETEEYMRAPSTDSFWIYSFKNLMSLNKWTQKRMEMDFPDKMKSRERKLKQQLDNKPVVDFKTIVKPQLVKQITVKDDLTDIFFRP